MNASPHVVVVGGGAVGASCALALVRRGARVTLVERGGSLAWACSAGSAGLVCPSHATPLASPAALRLGLKYLFKPDGPLRLSPRPALVPWIARFVAASTPDRAERGTHVLRELSLLGLAGHVALADEGLDTTLVRAGALAVYATEEALAGGRVEAAEARAAGVEAEELTAAEAAGLAPMLGPRVAGAVHWPGDAHCDGEAYTLAVGQAAVGRGASLRTRVEVLGLIVRDGRVRGVETTEGPIRADEVVLANGAWSPRLARQAGVVLPVEGGKGYHVEVELPGEPPPLPLWAVEARVIATPLAGRLRLAGTLELAGLDESIDARRVDAVVRAGGRLLPGLRGQPVRRVWRGLRPCSPDGLPVIGRPPGVDGLVLATGHGMMGLTLAPITGTLVAELVADDPPSVDLAPLAPARFGSLL
ncbi:MAG: FAD-dependent oxidoreductase [Thermoleophilia bacterium]